jgi:hypothetical protein
LTEYVGSHAPFDWQVKTEATSKALPIAVVAIGVIGLLLYRNHRLFIGPELWAEDTYVYFTQDRLFGISAILRPYNGFIQFICRVFAWVAGNFDPLYAPRLYASMFIVSICATATIVYTSPVFKGWAKCLAAITLLAAPTSSEVFLGMCYTQWVMGPLVALALIEMPTTRVRSVTLLGAVTLVGLSAPFVLIASPFIALKAYVERSRYAIMLCVVALVTSAFHFHYILARFSRSSSSGPLWLKLEALSSIFYRWATGSASGSAIGAAVIGIATVIATIYYLWSNRHIAQRTIIYVFGFGCALLIVSCWSLNGAERANQYGSASRYFYITVVTCLWTAILFEQERKRWTSATVCMLGLVGVLFFAHTDQDGKYFRDVNWPTTVKCLATESECISDINPSFMKTSRIPTDSQTRTLTPEERETFQIFPWLKT